MSTPEVDYEEGEELVPFVVGGKSETNQEKPSDKMSGEETKEEITTPTRMSDEEYNPWDNESPTSSEEGHKWPKWKKTLAEKIPGCDPDKHPWSTMLIKGTMERLDGKDHWDVVQWVGSFLEWRTLRKKRPVDKEEYGPLMASWSSFTTKALAGGREAVEGMLESARKREKHDREHSVTGIKQAIHDLCAKERVACRVLLYENACNECGFKALDDPEFIKPTRFLKNEELEKKLWQYESILNGRRVNWRVNFDANIDAGRRAHLAKGSNVVPKNHNREYSLSSARDSKSRESPFVGDAKRESRERESIQQDVALHHRSLQPVVGEDEKTEFDLDMEEDRDFLLQNYDPEEKLHRFEQAVLKRIAGFERTVATLESCVQSFATSLKQVTERCERVERDLRIRVKAQDEVMKSQHLRIQALETYHQEQRRAAAKRNREEPAQAAIGPVQTLRRRESLSRPSPSTPSSSQG